MALVTRKAFIYNLLLFSVSTMSSEDERCNITISFLSYRCAGWVLTVCLSFFLYKNLTLLNRMRGALLTHTKKNVYLKECNIIIHSTSKISYIRDSTTSFTIIENAWNALSLTRRTYHIQLSRLRKRQRRNE